MNKVLFSLTILLALGVLFSAFDGIIADIMRNLFITAFLVVVYLCFQDANEDLFQRLFS